MAQALRFHAVVSGKTLTLDELEAFDGKRVEVIVLEDESGDAAPDDAALRRSKRRFGTLAGKIKIAEDFDAPLPKDMQRAFDGETEA